MKFLVTLLLFAGAHFTLTATMPAQMGKGWILWPFAADSQAVLHLSGDVIVTFTKWLSVIAGACFLAAIMALFGWVVPAELWSVADSTIQNGHVLMGEVKSSSCRNPTRNHPTKRNPGVKQLKKP